MSYTTNELHLNILRKIESVEDQKTLAQELGFSVGKINYVLKKLGRKRACKN